MKHKKDRILRVFYTVLVGVMGFSMLLPFFWMISTSFKIESEVFEFPIRWIPRTPDFNNYNEAWNGTVNLGRSYWNSIKVSVLSTILQVTISAMAGYAFAKIDFKFKKPLFMIYLATMMVPAQVTLIPCFMIFKEIGLMNSHLGLVFLTCFSVYGVFMLRQFIGAIPMEISQAAIVDGASHFQIFAKIIVPISKPAIATLAMLKFIWTWNDYMNPMIFLSSAEKYTLQIAMRSFSSEYGEQYGATMAAAVLAIMPLLILFLVCQKNVIEGISVGAVKG